VPKVFLLTLLSLYYKLYSIYPSPSTQPLLAVDLIVKMPRLKLFKKEYKLRRNAVKKKWERKVRIRQESPPLIVLAHRPVTRSQSVKAQPVVQARSGPEPASTYALPTPVLPLSKALLNTAVKLRAELKE
jgi:hypothetical protein